MLAFIRKILIFFTLVGLIVIGFISFKVYKISQYENPKDVTIRIRKGTTVKKIAEDLEALNLIENKLIFEFYLRLTGKGRQLKAGEYDFKKGLTLNQVIDQMIAGKVKLYKFTIPEGFNLKDVCKLMVEKQLMTVENCGLQVVRVDLPKAQPKSKRFASNGIK